MYSSHARLAKYAPVLLTAMLAASANAQRVIEEVVVTAQKKEQGLIDVPASVSVVGGELAAEAALIDAQDIVQYTPNVKLNTSNSNPVLAIRGFGTPPLARNIEPSVGVVINDVYYGRVTFVNDGAFDMQRLEVLRGPQGTLFGKNTVSGVLNFTTQPADPELKGYINLAAGSLDERRAEGGVSFPVISDRIGARLAFRVRDKETGNYNTTTDKDDTLEEESFRVKLGWALGDFSSLGFEYFQTDSEAVGFGFQLQEATDRALAEYRNHDPRTEDDITDGNRSTQATGSERHAKSWVLRFDTGWEGIGFFNNLDMSIIANKAEIRSPFTLDTDFSPIFFSTLSTIEADGFDQKSVEWRFSGDTAAPFGWGEGLDFVTGLFFFNSESAATQQATNELDQLDDVLRSGQGGLPPGTENAAAALLVAAERSNDPNKERLLTTNISALENESWSVFTQLTWFLTDRMDLTLGMRYGEEDKNGFTGSETNSVITAQRIAGVDPFFETYKETEYVFDPKLAFSWELFDDFRVFAVVASGTKGGGVSGPLIAPIDTTYRPEEAFSKEIGIKSFLLDKTLQLNLTAYDVEYKDLQVQAFAGVQLTTLNAAEATGRGVELDFQWLPDWQALTVAGSIGYSDTAYEDYPCAPGTASMDAANNPPGCDNDIPRQDLSGREIPYGPKWSASLYPTLKFPLSDTWGMLVGLDILHQGEFYLDIDLDEQSRHAPVTKVNLRLGLKQLDGGWSIVFNAKNLTKAEERQLMLDSPRNAGNYTSLALPVEPLYSLDFRYAFGE